MELQQPAMTKRELLDLIDREHAAFDATIARVPRERLDEPGLPGGWSVKDVLHHVAWGHHEAIGAARAQARGLAAVGPAPGRAQRSDP